MSTKGASSSGSGSGSDSDNASGNGSDFGNTSNKNDNGKGTGKGSNENDIDKDNASGSNSGNNGSENDNGKGVGKGKSDLTEMKKKWESVRRAKRKAAQDAIDRVKAKKIKGAEGVSVHDLLSGRYEEGAVVNIEGAALISVNRRVNRAGEVIEMGICDVDNAESGEAVYIQLWTNTMVHRGVRTEPNIDDQDIMLTIHRAVVGAVRSGKRTLKATQGNNTQIILTTVKP